MYFGKRYFPRKRVRGLEKDENGLVAVVNGGVGRKIKARERDKIGRKEKGKKALGNGK